MTAVGVLIPVEGTVEEIEFDGRLETLQGLVGGYIETLALRDDVTCIFDEEGKCKGLPPNGGATYLFGGRLMPGDTINGPAVLLGEVDGDFVDAPEDVMELVGTGVPQLVTLPISELRIGGQE